MYGLLIHKSISDLTFEDREDTPEPTPSPSLLRSPPVFSDSDVTEIREPSPTPTVRFQNEQPQSRPVAVVTATVLEVDDSSTSSLPSVFGQSDDGERQHHESGKS